MKRYYENLLIMMKILYAWALSPSKLPVTQQVGIFYQGMLNLKAKAALIDSLRQMLSLTGIAMDKKALRAILCKIIISIIKPVKAYAIATSNNTLMEEVSFSFTDLMRMKAQDLVDKARTLHTLILPLLPALQADDYLVDSALLTSMGVAATTFEAIQNKPVMSIKNRKSINESIMENMMLANAIVHNVLDLNSVSFETIDSAYFAEYKIYRSADQSVISHTRLIAHLEDENNTVFPLCTVTVNAFVKDGKTFKAVSGITDIKGDVTIKEFEPGIRSVTVSGPSIISHTFENLLFENGKALTRTFICTPSFTNIPVSQPGNESVNS